MARICDNCGHGYRQKYIKRAEGSVRLSAAVNLGISLEILGNVDICDNCMERLQCTLESEAKNFLQSFIMDSKNPMLTEEEAINQ